MEVDAELHATPHSTAPLDYTARAACHPPLDCTTRLYHSTIPLDCVYSSLQACSKLSHWKRGSVCPMYRPEGSLRSSFGSRIILFSCWFPCACQHGSPK